MENKPKAIMLMLVSTLSFAFMSAVVKLTGDFPTYQQILFRNSVSLLVAFIMIKKQGVSLFGKKENQKFLLLRSCLGLGGVMLSFYAINNLMLADSSILSRLAPFFVMIFAAIFLGEKLTRRNVFALIGVFIGVLLVIKPEFDMSVVPAMAGVVAAILAAGAYTVVGYLKNKEHPSTIVFYFSLVSVIGMIPLALPVFVMPTLTQLGMLILIGIFASIGQYGLTYAYKYAPASEVAIFNHTNVIFSAVIGFFVFGEIPDALSLLGGAIIIGIAYILFELNRREDIAKKEAEKFGATTAK